MRSLSPCHLFLTSVLPSPIYLGSIQLVKRQRRYRIFYLLTPSNRLRRQLCEELSNWLMASAASDANSISAEYGHEPVVEGRRYFQPFCCESLQILHFTLVLFFSHVKAYHPVTEIGEVAL